jgi:PAS domain S-box-containing protein
MRAWLGLPTSSTRRLPLGIIALSAAIIAVLWSALVYDATRAHDVEMEQAVRDSRNLVVAFREHIRRSVGAIDQLMVTIAADHAANPAEFRLPAWAADSQLLEGMLVQVGLMDRNGIFRTSNLPVTAPVDLSDRAHFRHHLDPAAPQPYISAPVIGRVSNKWSIQFTRRLTRDGSTFDGVVVVSIDPFYFSNFFDSVNLGRNGAAALVGLDGIVRSRREVRKQDIGQDVRDSPLFRALRASNSGSYEATSPFDGIERTVSYTTVENYPLVVLIALATDDVLAAPREVERTRLAIGAVLTAIILVLTWFMIREAIRRRDAERKRRDDSFRLLFDGNPVPMWLVDVETTNFIAVNDAALVHYGYSRDRFLQMSLLDICRPEDRADLGRRFALRDSSVSEDRTSRHVKADGRIIDVMVYRRRLQYQGREASLVGIIDVTERRRIEEDRDRNRDFLNRIIEAVPVTIYVKDAHEKRYILLNRAGEQLWGLPREKIIGKTALEIFDAETSQRVSEKDEDVLRSGSDLSLAAHAMRMPNNSVRMVSTRRLTISKPNGEPQYLLGVVEDLTEHRAIEEQLRQSQKLEAIGHLTGGIAHDFNNLLTVIIGNLELLREEAAGNREAEDKIDAVLRASERGTDLAGRMLAFARREPLQAKPADLNRLVADAMRMLSRTLDEAITIGMKLVPDVGTVFVDAQQFEMALMNIAINARDAMPSGGTLHVATRTEEFAAGDPRLHPEAPAGAYAVVEISDTGSGMAPEVIEHIFEPFFTTKPTGKGTGLGLSMVYGFMQQSGGYVRAESEVGHGTTFRLYFPLLPHSATQTEAPAPALRTPKNVGGGEVILAVDDNAAVRATVVMQLKQLGYTVREADGALAALQIINGPDKIDLLFTDVVMPGGMNGKDLAVEARRRRPDLPILFTSGFPGTSQDDGIRFEEHDVLLSKPYRKQDLARAVREMLATRN